MSRFRLVWLLLLAVLATAQAKPPATVVFVCEHGAAKSVVAAAYFNKMAKQQHVNVHAIARGTNPQADVSAKVVEGLKADGVSSEVKRPRSLSDADIQGAARIIAFCPVPEKYAHVVETENWSDVPGTEGGYAPLRDAIVKRLQSLIDEVKPAPAKKR